MKLLLLMQKFVVVCALLCISLATVGQNTRIKDENSSGWWASTGTLAFSKKWSLHVEYQWRREDVLRSWQQSLVRTGINYHLNNRVTLRAGYAWVETFNYGSIPLQAAGRTFTEHRSYQVATITDKLNKLELSHRFMLEQRWVGRFADAQAAKETDYLYSNRLRYMFRMQHPLIQNKNSDRQLYAAVYDEIIIGFGKNVAENVFDQNRIGALVGYRFSPRLRIEGGYFNQILQLGREINGRNVFQYNQGIIVNSFWNLKF